ncbi:twinfilin-2-A-like isoform X2 [Zophobas morio]|uniref:twinfilin-2-A-like isoform X2 n=1 Tax=Zophobas morio TaxID=2755281 RepID=UPI003083DC83
MSLQTGIRPNEELETTFKVLREPFCPLRACKISIISQELVCSGILKAKTTFEQEYDSIVASLLKPSEPCYILLRSDKVDKEKISLWVFISYIPEDLKVRDKMVYAATKSTLKKFFGGCIDVEISGTTPAEILYSGYTLHRKLEGSTPPLSLSEIEKKELESLKVVILFFIKLCVLLMAEKAMSSVGLSTRYEVASKLSFPLNKLAVGALKELANFTITFVSLALNLDEETTCLDQRANSTVKEISAELPSESPRYLFIAFNHEREGAVETFIIFVYFCPGFKCSIKERMCYSSCKSSVVTAAEELGLKITTKIEIASARELTEENILSELFLVVVPTRKSKTT